MQITRISVSPYLAVPQVNLCFPLVLVFESSMWSLEFEQGNEISSTNKCQRHKLVTESKAGFMITNGTVLGLRKWTSHSLRNSRCFSLNA